MRNIKLIISSLFLVGAGITFVLASQFDSDLHIITLVFSVLSLVNFIQYKSTK